MALFLKAKTLNLKPRGGQAVLSLVFIIGAIITTIGLSLAILATSFINSTSGFQAVERSQAVATSGVYDAMLRLSRSKGLSGTYSVPLDGESANVTITQDSPASGLVTIVSSSTVSRKEIRIRAIISRNSTSGEISLVSWGQY